MDIKIKTLNLCKNLKDVKSWVVNLKRNEILYFYLDEEKDARSKITVFINDIGLYTVKLNDIAISHYSYSQDELFNDIASAVEQNLEFVDVYFATLEGQ